MFAVMRTGGTAALTYGQANTGVACTMLYQQRQAVCAASFPGQQGDLDISLAFVDGSARGKADPAFAAHTAPIGLWAQAVWSGWFPRPALSKMADHATEHLANAGQTMWAKVTGPAKAMVASAWRLGWKVVDFQTLSTDDGHTLQLTRDSPALVSHMVEQAVRRWRWSRVEAKLPALGSGGAGHGPFFAPIYKLLDASAKDWGHKERGACRSVVANRQWPQDRLFKAGLVDNFNCRLCVEFGLCDAEDPDPRHRVTLTHRHWLCPVFEPQRMQLVPRWLLREVRASLIDGHTLPPQSHALYNRALLRSPANYVPRPTCLDTFEWIKQPDEWPAQGRVYSEASRLDGD